LSAAADTRIPETARAAAAGRASSEEAAMYARVVTFAIDPASIDVSVDFIRRGFDELDEPYRLDGAQLMLVDRSSGKGLKITFFEREEDLHRAFDEHFDAQAGPTTIHNPVE
jgi:hypothetical protein